METKSKSAMSSVNNSGPGQGKKKASTGNPLDLGLSSQSKIEGGTAGKLRGENKAQKPKSGSKSMPGNTTWMEN